MIRLIVAIMIFSVALILILANDLLGARHETDWRETFRNSAGVACCDDSDCDRVNSTWDLQIGSITDTKRFQAITINRIYLSLDGYHWVCNTGCAFRPVGI